MGGEPAAAVESSFLQPSITARGSLFLHSKHVEQLVNNDEEKLHWPTPLVQKS